MRSLLVTTVFTLLFPVTNALADSCYDLWYQLDSLILTLLMPMKG